MADQKISALSAATALGGTEVVPGVQSAANVKITAAQIQTYVLGNSFIQFTGPSASVKTFTLPNSNGTLTTVNGSFGTPASVVLTNATGLPLTTGVTGLLPVANGGIGVGTLTGIAKGNGTGAFTAATAGTDYVAPGGALGTPSSGTATNLTGLPLTTGVTGTLPTANGGTNLTGFTAANNAIYSTSSSALTAGTLPIAAGGTASTTANAAREAINRGTAALTDGANISTNCANGNVFTVTLGGNRTLDNPTNKQTGATYIWIITQDGTGSRTLSYGTDFTWPAGSAPTLTTTANAVDTICAIYDGTKLRAVCNKGFA